MASLKHLPIVIEVDGADAVISQRVGESDDETVTIRISGDQALQVATFLSKHFGKKAPGAHSGSEEGFDRFWETYPRKETKAASRDIWKRKGLSIHIDAIVAHVESCKVSQQWRSGYIPMPVTYLNQRRWEDAADRSDMFVDAK